MVCYDCGEPHLNITASLSLLDFGECDIYQNRKHRGAYATPIARRKGGGTKLIVLK